MTTYKDHEVTIDQTEADILDTAAFAAFCSCGWRGEWHHADIGSLSGADAHIEATRDAYRAALFDEVRHLETVDINGVPLLLRSSHDPPLTDGPTDVENYYQDGK